MSFLKYVFSILILACCWNLILIAQSFPVKNYTEEDGLPSSTVYDVAQDSVGRMWFATRNGICRYDGYNWDVFNTQSGLPANDFIKIKIDKNGNVWALSVDPLYLVFMFNGKEWKNYPNNLDEFSRCIPVDFDIKVDSDTSIVVATSESGIIIYNKSKWNSITTKDGLSSNQINKIVIINDNIYAATLNGLSIISENRIENILPKRSILGIFEETNNEQSDNSRIWLLGSNEIGYIQNKIYSKVISNFKLSDKGFARTGVILNTGNDKIIFGSRFTLFTYDAQTKKINSLGVGEGLISEGAYSIFKDRENIIWIAGFRGVSKIVSMRLNNYNQASGLFKSEVTSVVERRKGEYIFGHFNGITIYDGKKFLPISFEDEKYISPIRNRVQDIAIDKYKNVWIAAENSGVGLLDLNNKIKWYSLPQGGLTNVYSVEVDSNNNIYASNRYDIFKLMHIEFKKIDLPNKFKDFLKRKLFIDKNKNLIIATSESGIIVKNSDDEFKVIKSSTNSNANNVYSVYSNYSSQVFVGTIAGLFTVDSDTLKKYSNGDFQIDRPVYFILNDNKGSFWFGTDNGVINWNGDKFFNIGYNEGLIGLETNRDAGYIDSEGRLWIGTNNGVSEYIERYDQVLESRPNLIFQKFATSERDYFLNDELIFEYDKNDITFHFRAISFINEKENTYKVKLDGFDSEWLNEFKSDNPQIRYTNLPPGNYKIRIKARNAAGVWSKEIISPLITIIKPYYQQMWFNILLLLIIVGIAVLIFLIFQKNLYSKKLKTEVELRTSQLNETQERYRRMFEGNSTIMLLVDAENLKIIDANPSARNFYGYDQKAITKLKFNFLEEEIDLESCRKKLSGTSQFYQAIHKTVLNGSRNVEVYPSNLTLEDKPVIYIIINDITERLIAEKVVQESEEKFRGLVDNIQDGVFLIQHGIIQYCNMAFSSMLGYKVDEAIGKSISEFLAHESEEVVMQYYKSRQIGKDVPDEYEAALIHKNGFERVFVNIHAGLTVLNGKVATIGTVKNISEKKKQEEQLTKLSTAVEQSPVCVFMTDTESRIEYVNPMFSELYGYEPEEVIGQLVSILKSGNSSDHEYSTMWQTIKSGNIWRGELLNKSKDGRNHWVSAAIAPVINSDNVITHYIAVEEDITFDKYARQEIENNEKLLNSVLSNVPLIIFALDEKGIIKVSKGTIINDIGLSDMQLVGKSAYTLKDQFQYMEEDLNRALLGEAFTVVRELNNVITEMTFTPILSDDFKPMGSIGVAYDITERFKFEQELKEAKQEAEKSDRLKSEFLAQMSHEIRTPINSVLSFSTLIKDHLEGELSEELAQSFDFIEAGGRRLIRTIDMILNMSQFQTDSYEPNLEKLDLDNDVLKLVLNELSSLAKHKNLKLVYNCNTKNNFVNGDRYTIGQIFVNLIENAIKYSFEGEINIDLFEEGDKLVVDVSDKGIGISEEFLPALFSPFLQEERGYTRKYEGNGLGLALVQKYVDVNNAEVSVKSEKGIGSTFTVKFNKV